MSQTQAKLDPYTAQAESNNPTPQEKINGLNEILQSVQTAMMTTRSGDGELHSRAMNLASKTSDEALSFVFVANNASHKFEEIDNDAHVNISFFDRQTSNWVSVCGKARVSRDRDDVKKYWTRATSAWFGDMEDGIHKGDENDPRISIIEVVPDEIRYWYATKGKLARAVEIGIGAATRKVASPGEIRTISKDEIRLVQRLHTQN